VGLPLNHMSTRPNLPKSFHMLILNRVALKRASGNQAVRVLVGRLITKQQIKYLDFIDIYAALDDNELAEYQRDYPDEAKTMSRFAERFREESMQQGMHQGETLVLERLLRLKFGALPDEIQRRITQANEQTLLQWSEQVLTASRLDEALH